MTPPDIARIRLRNQRLIGRKFTDPAQVVRYLGAVQSQDYAGGKWGLGLRMDGIGDAQVERAFNEGRILRTHVMRPTWHFVTPEDIGWLIALTGPRVSAVNAPIYRQVGLDGATIKRSTAVLARALQGHNFLTRAELATALQAAGIATAGTLRLAYFVMAAELDGVVCSGPRRGKQATYALLEERAPNTKKLERDEALVKLIGRYFLSRGPATLADFAWWSGLTVADAKHGVELLGSRIDQVRIDGRQYWFAEKLPRTQNATPVAHLLPNYDEYFIGFKDRSAIARELDKSEPAADKTAINAHVVVVDGQVVGGWRRTLKKDAGIVEMDLLTTISKKGLEALDVAVERYGEFMGLPVKVIRRPARRAK